MKFLQSKKVQPPDRPHLDLSGPLVTRAFESLIASTEDQGGIERYTDALKLKSQLFQQALGGGDPASMPLETFKGLCAFMASVRRRVGSFLEKPAYLEMTSAMAELFDGVKDTTTTDRRMGVFCDRFPKDKKHRWVRDLAGELLHGADPERYPLMLRWVWDAKANTGVIREIWYGDEVDNITLPVVDGYGTYLMLREELSQFLTDNGVFRDVIYYIDLLCAKIYADYIGSQGGAYLRSDFSTPEDPMEHTRRLLGLDGVKAGSGRTRLKSINGESFEITDGPLLS